mmetsp:Transcript_38488/g.85702  ORF Transcript_38488/g.85702 Transcript_38488/m.85702 type:complete len:246 (+) Transcript_38488:1627-2364(+)
MLAGSRHWLVYDSAVLRISMPNIAMGTLKVTKFSCVKYATGDLVGKALAYVSLLPFCVILHTASCFYSRRAVHEMLLPLGLVVNETLARFLKHVLKQPRPVEMCQDLDLCNSHGMPSSHTQCMFFALSLQSAILLRHFSSKSNFSRAVDILELLGLSAASAAVACSRVYLGYHSVQQVLVGAGLGLLFGLMWYMVMSKLAPVYKSLASSRLGSVLQLKDTWPVAEALAVEREALANHAARKLKAS